MGNRNKMGFQKS